MLLCYSSGDNNKKVCVCVTAVKPGSQPAATNPWAGSVATSRVPDPTVGPAAHPPSQRSPSNPFVSSAHNGVLASPTQQQQPLPQQQRQQGFQHSRSHSIDTGELSFATRGWNQQQQQSQKPTLLSMARQAGTNFQQHNGAATSAWPQTATAGLGSAAAGSQGVDPFDVAWAAKAVNKPSPLTGSKQVKQFEVQL